MFGRSAAFTVKPSIAAGFTFCIFFFFFLLDLEAPPPPAAPPPPPPPVPGLAPAPPPVPDDELWSAKSGLPLLLVKEEVCSPLELRVLSLVRDLRDCRKKGKGREKRERERERKLVTSDDPLPKTLLHRHSCQLVSIELHVRR